MKMRRKTLLRNTLHIAHAFNEIIQKKIKLNKNTRDASKAKYI